MSTTDPLASLDFPSPFTFYERTPCTLVEFRLRHLSNQIRAKPSWWTKVHDPALVAKWRAEMVAQDRAAVDELWGLPDAEGKREYEEYTPKGWPRDLVTDAQLDYIFDELRDAAGRRDSATGIYASAIPQVYESRSLIPPELKAALMRDAGATLESVPEEEKDWHPGSNGQVLDLVHPSLYPLRIGTSYARGVVLAEEAYRDAREDLDEDEFDAYAYSPRFQWLPTDFAVSSMGAVRAESYVNNLHPVRHRALYPTIAALLGRFVPIFERVLTDATAPERAHIIAVNPGAWYDHLQEPDWGDDDPDRWKYEEWQKTYRWPRIPDPPPFVPHDEPAPLSLRGRTLQVIVKMANIVLTPENPSYPGGAWHVEGMANERIVATGLYYYACANITTSRLAFRTTAGTLDGLGMPYEQGDYQGYLAAYGFAGGNALNQPLGYIVAEEDKCVAFPNAYQHHVEPFELADPSRPGYRKILCFFLVNPVIRIVSTSDVPPQQRDWVSADDEAGVQGLPRELVDIIVGYAQTGTISREEAEGDREALMKERAGFVVEHNEQVFEVEFNMCEH